MSYIYKYPHPAVTTDCVILTFHEEKLKILLVRRGIEPYKGSWALPGGFLRMDESAEEGALRELREETGVTGCTIRQFHTFSAPGRDPRERVVTIAFYALMKWQQATGADDAEFAGWLPVSELPPLAFDHREIVDYALQCLRRDIFFEPVGFDLLDEVFSMSDLQKVYEAILGRQFDRRNFAKKMKHLQILDEVKEDDEEGDFPGIAFGKINHCFGRPLPFLYDNDAMDMEEEFSAAREEDLFMESSYSMRVPQGEEKKVPSKQRRRGLLWRFNRKKYDRMKDDNMFEF